MTKPDRIDKSHEEIARICGVPNVDTHLFLCTGPDCVDTEQGMAAWQKLKAKVKALFPRLPEARLYRTRVACLRICKGGPIAVCYPQGRWFRGVTEDRVEELVEYICSGAEEPHPLEFQRRPLPPP